MSTSIKETTSIKLDKESKLQDLVPAASNSPHN